MKFVSRLFASFIAGPLCCCSAVTATETENFGIAVLPTPGSVIVDGKTDDWDLTGGLFACGDVENLRDTMSLWYHAMYDADNLYLLARWNDATPLNNPGVTSGDLGFRGDCLQTRVITEFDKPDERVTHLTCWRGKDGRDVVKLDLGRRVNEGEIADLKSLGAKQAFLVATDGRHYAQEIAIPWAQLAVNKKSPGPGGEVRLAIEANFTVGSDGRMTIKDCFQPGVALDRVFTFRAVTQWGSAKLERAGNVSPRKVRLSDGREFAVHLEKGQPVVDWTGLQQASEVASLKTIPFDMPEDGYASVVLRAEGGSVVRHLLNSQRLAKGRHELKWDGLATYNWKQPGDPVPAGTYQATALVHKELDLRLVGWADNSGTTPWDFPATSGNWGGDHGNPTAAAADKDKVYLGWTGAEAGKAVVACDLTGKPVWHHTRGGIGSGSAIATDGGIVFVVDRITKPVLYRLDSRTGQYSGWQGRDTAELELDKVFENLTDPKADRFSLAGGGGRLYLASQSLGQIAVLDAATGAVQERLTIPSPQSLALSSDGKLYVLTAGTVVVRDGNQFKPVLRDLTAPASIAVDGRGQIYVGVGEPDNQVKVYAADGKIVRTIGRAGGRALLGPWTPEGMRFVDGIVLDAQGKVWVMENDAAPRRVSAWNADGTLAHEFFGGTSYGAPGGSICPSDPFVMAGQGCEWRIDPKTGLARCTAVVLREGMELSRFVSSPEGRVYLYVYSNAGASSAPTRIFERLGDGQYKLRSVLFYADEGGNELPPSPRGKMAGAKQTMLWADANDDGQRQKDEITGGEGEMRFSGWFMYVTPDGALYSGDKQFKLKGLTACGAPLYDLAHPTIMPAPGLGSTDGRLVFTWNREGIERGWNQVFEIATGKQRFQYPDTFVGVHGSHKAPPPIDGLIRGAFPPCGTAKLPEPIGNIWVIPTNVGEWHVLSEHGYYLARLFEPDPLKVEWPKTATPGANLDKCPPGSGGEDFGGSIMLANDGKLYLQTGKTAFWNVRLDGLDTARELTVGSVTLDPADVPLAQKIHDDYLQAAATQQPMWVKRRTVTFTGNIAKDFGDAPQVKFEKQAEAQVKSVITWDDKNLYLGWEVRDQTPWINGATDRDLMYIGGDTVDFQLATDPKLKPKRTEAERGDLRLSIGPFQGKPQAVLYRHVAERPHPRTFSSGVQKDYVMESVTTVDDAEIFIRKIGNDRYVVEARVPLSALDFTAQAGLELRGDVGVTHGDAAGQRTRLRTYWANQHTGIVDDAVFELKMNPSLWGTLIFSE